MQTLVKAAVLLRLLFVSCALTFRYQSQPHPTFPYSIRAHATNFETVSLTKQYGRRNSCGQQELEASEGQT